MKTPLYDQHVKLGAKMTEFAGWTMPVQYKGIAHEVEVVRKKVGLFDICHMGEFIVSGEYALSLIQYVTTNDVSKLTIGHAQYSLLCNPEGGVIDDLIVYRTGQQEYLLIVNASNVKNDFDWIKSHNSFAASLTDKSDDTALIAVQGPLAEQLLNSIAGADLKSLKRFNITDSKISGIRCKIARTGYTGEDGFEILCAMSDVEKLWLSLLENGEPLGVEPIGLGARDVLRVEPAYSLYGNELSMETSPVAARLMWVVKPDKGDFIGKSAILDAKKTGTKTILIGIEAIDRCIPRHGCDIIVDGLKVGSITSGTFSPTLGKSIALGYIDRKFSKVGTIVNILTSGRTCACKVVPTPFYK